MDVEKKCFFYASMKKSIEEHEQFLAALGGG